MNSYESKNKIEENFNADHRRIDKKWVSASKKWVSASEKSNFQDDDEEVYSNCSCPLQGFKYARLMTKS